jgi:hypothetical protein
MYILYLELQRFRISVLKGQIDVLSAGVEQSLGVQGGRSVGQNDGEFRVGRWILPVDGKVLKTPRVGLSRFGKASLLVQLVALLLERHRPFQILHALDQVHAEASKGRTTRDMVDLGCSTLESGQGRQIQRAN